MWLRGTEGGYIFETPVPLVGGGGATFRELGGAERLAPRRLTLPSDGGRSPRVRVRGQHVKGVV